MGALDRRALASIESLGEPGVHDLTLLELVRAICEVTHDDREVVATVTDLLQSGRVRLIGNFRNRSLNAA